MGIGTSLGAYFETELDHHAGNSFQLDQDKNVVDPAEGLANKYKEEPLEGTFSGGYDNNEVTDSAVMRSLATKPKIIPVSDIKTSSPLVTITDADIDKGMGLGMSFSGGGLTTSEGKVLQMRKAANDNKKLQIDDPVMDAGIEDAWSRMVRGSEIVEQRSKLMDKLRDTGLNDLETQNLKNLDKQHAEHFGDAEAPKSMTLREHFDENVTKPHEEFIANYDKLHSFMMDTLTKKGGWTELNVARYNKMGRELDSEWTPVDFDPLK